MKKAEDVIPWLVTDISSRPYRDFWSFNPSIHFDGAQWRCVLRCCDYAMPNGVTVRSKSARPSGQQTKNAMVILDPANWKKPIKIYRMHEKDDHPRASTPHVGYEDMRLFKTDKGGLQGIAASLHLRRETRWAAAENRPQHQSPEQVIVSFDGDYNIVDAHPIRGDGWSGTPQKNWVPFDDCTEPRFLYSIHRGTMFNTHGSVHGDKARAHPSTNARPVAESAPAAPVAEASLVSPPVEDPLPRERPDAVRREHSSRRSAVRGGDVQIVRGRRVVIDAVSSRPSSRPSSRGGGLADSVHARVSDTSRSMSAGRVRLPGYEGLRGGTQLVRVGDDAWLGIGHEMKFVNSKKYYWHCWYVVDSSGSMTSVSEPMKLVSNGIEFAAGLAIDGDRVVVSFGVDDMECKLGETRLSAVMEMMRQVER